MKMKKKHEKALKIIREALGRVEIKGKASSGPSPGLLKAVKTATTTGYVGWINHAGRVADGTYQVQFDIAGNGWSSRWPAWAYEAALPALLHGKKVWVISTGLPYGSNLLQVLVTNQDV